MCRQTWLAGGDLFLLCPRRASSAASYGLPFHVQPTAFRATPARLAAALNGHGYRRHRSRRYALSLRSANQATLSTPPGSRFTTGSPKSSLQARRPGRLQAAACSGTVLPPTCPGCHRNPHPLADRRPTRPRLSHNLLAYGRRLSTSPHAVWLRHFDSVVRAPLIGGIDAMGDAGAAPTPWPAAEPCGSALECRQAFSVNRRP